MYGVFYIWIGVLHFIKPSIFAPIVPRILGVPIFWVYLSGVAEIFLGLGLCIPRYRRIASQWIILLLCVLYTANFNMWYNAIPFQGYALSHGEHIVRGVVQISLIALTFWVGRGHAENEN